MDNLAKVNSDIKAAYEEFESEYEAEINKLDIKEKQLVHRQKQLDANKKKVAEDNGDVDATGDDVVEINAGGEIIDAVRSALTQFQGTMLEAMFSGRWDKVLTRDSAGRIFLDVNPVCFQAIIGLPK